MRLLFRLVRMALPHLSSSELSTLTALVIEEHQSKIYGPFYPTYKLAEKLQKQAYLLNSHDKKKLSSSYLMKLASSLLAEMLACESFQRSRRSRQKLARS